MKLPFALVLSLAVIESAYAQWCPACTTPEGPGLECTLHWEGNSVYFRTIDQFACRVSVIASYGEFRKDSCRRTFGPPFLLIDYKVHEHSYNNDGMSASRYASGAKVEYEEHIREAYDQAIHWRANMRLGRKGIEARAEHPMITGTTLHLCWFRPVLPGTFTRNAVDGVDAVS